MPIEEAFNHRGIMSRGFLQLSPMEALACCQEGSVLIDVREDYLGRYKTFDVPAWIHLPCSTLVLCHTRLPHDQPLILADTAGIRSHEACDLLKQLGYTTLANLVGGLIAWERAGLPLHLDPTVTPTDQYILSLKKEARKRKKK